MINRNRFVWRRAFLNVAYSCLYESAIRRRVTPRRCPASRTISSRGSANITYIAAVGMNAHSLPYSSTRGPSSRNATNKPT